MVAESLSICLPDFDDERRFCAQNEDGEYVNGQKQSHERKRVVISDMWHPFRQRRKGWVSN